LDLEQLRQLLELVREHELSEFEIEHEGLRVRIRKDTLHGGAAALPVAAAVPAAATSAPAAVAGAALNGALASAASEITETAGSETEIELAVVKSPIVGTFYRSPEPGAASFVEIGSTVKKGDVLCIIEAMKLMNEIDSEYDGEVVNIYVEAGQSVQYGERLFAIRTR
jgi:acetyl-CoA carboxylase biotin carboxyl carrier protein